MAGSTSHYGLQRLTRGESFSLNGYKYTNADREQIDQLLYLGAEGHHHTGAASISEEPESPPTLTLLTSGGTIPAGTRVYYKFTYVDLSGNESAGSTEAFVDTPAAVDEPGAPSLATSVSGGTHLPGNYYYVLTAYTTSITQETLALNPAYITVPAGSNTNTITLTMPTKPTGATGFNIYRRAPGGAQYLYLASTTGTSYTDNNSVEEDCNRTLPRRNTTNSQNAVSVSLPGATPTSPEGLTWKVYRTYVTNNWDSSFLHWVVEETFEGSGVILSSYEDVGNGTTPGKPPSITQFTTSPQKIDLTDAVEVQGSMPLGLTAFPWVVTFSFPGSLASGSGTHVWCCEFPAATIIGCRATLGRGYVPSSTPVIVDVNKGTGATPVFSTIYTTTANRPSVPVGVPRGERTTPDVRTLVVGDLLTVDIDQTGGGATPTDQDLTVNVYLIAHGYPAAISFVAGSSTGT